MQLSRPLEKWARELIKGAARRNKKPVALIKRSTDTFESYDESWLPASPDGKDSARVALFFRENRFWNPLERNVEIRAEDRNRDSSN